MVRAVLDTNLLVSYALTKGGMLSKLIDHWEKGSFVFLTLSQIIEELREVLGRPYIREKMVADPQALIESVELDTECIPGKLQLTGVCRDPKDDIFITCAVEGGADYIVSQDNDLLDLGEYQGIEIVRPEEFIAFLELIEEAGLENLGGDKGERSRSDGTRSVAK